MAITSKQRGDEFDVTLREEDFLSGMLRTSSAARIHRIFTAEKTLVHYRAGTLTQKKMNEVEEKLIQLIKN